MQERVGRCSRNFLQSLSVENEGENNGSRQQNELWYTAHHTVGGILNEGMNRTQKLHTCVGHPSRKLVGRISSHHAVNGSGYTSHRIIMEYRWYNAGSLNSLKQQSKITTRRSHSLIHMPVAELQGERE